MVAPSLALADPATIVSGASIALLVRRGAAACSSSRHPDVATPASYARQSSLELPLTGQSRVGHRRVVAPTTAVQPSGRHASRHPIVPDWSQLKNSCVAKIFPTCRHLPSCAINVEEPGTCGTWLAAPPARKDWRSMVEIRRILCPIGFLGLLPTGVRLCRGDCQVVRIDDHGVSRISQFISCGLRHRSGRRCVPSSRCE